MTKKEIETLKEKIARDVKELDERIAKEEIERQALRSRVKELCKQGIIKEEVIKQITTEFPEITRRKVSSIISGFYFQQVGYLTRLRNAGKLWLRR